MAEACLQLGFKRLNLEASSLRLVPPILSSIKGRSGLLVKVSYKPVRFVCT